MAWAQITWSNPFRCRLLTKDCRSDEWRGLEILNPKGEEKKNMSDKIKIGDTATVKNVAALNARVLILEAANETLRVQLDKSNALLEQANDLIEGDTKAQLVKDASEVSEISLPELAGKDILELETIIDVSKQVRKTSFESGGDVAVINPKKFNSRTHLHSVYNRSRKD